MSTNELLYRIMQNRDSIPVGISVLDAVKQVTGYGAEVLKSRSRKREHVEARQIAMYFYIRNGVYTKRAGEVVGRDHATAIHAKRRIQELYGQKSERVLTEMVDKVSDLTGIRL